MPLAKKVLNQFYDTAIKMKNDDAMRKKAKKKKKMRIFPISNDEDLLPAVPLTNAYNAEERLWKLFASYSSLCSAAFNSLDHINNSHFVQILERAGLLGKKISTKDFSNLCWRINEDLYSPTTKTIRENFAVQLTYAQFRTILWEISFIISDSSLHPRDAMINMLNTQFKEVMISELCNPTDMSFFIAEADLVLQEFRPSLLHIFNYYADAAQRDLIEHTYANLLHCHRLDKTTKDGDYKGDSYTFANVPATEVVGNVMGYTAFLSFGRTFGLATDTLSEKEWDRLFITCSIEKVRMKNNRTKEHQITFSKFLEALVRVAVSRYGQGSARKDMKALFLHMTRSVVNSENEVHYKMKDNPGTLYLKENFVNAGRFVMAFKAMWLRDNGKDYIEYARTRLATMSIITPADYKQHIRHYSI